MAPQTDSDLYRHVFALLIPVDEHTDTVVSPLNPNKYALHSSADAPVSSESTPLPFTDPGHLILRLSDTETGSWTLGSDNGCDVVLKGRGVSRQHCTIAYDRHGFVILKDSSTYGTSVHYDYGHPKLLLTSEDTITLPGIGKLYTSIQVSIGPVSFFLQLNYDHMDKPDFDKICQSRQQALPEMGMLRVDSLNPTEAPGTPEELTNLCDFGGSAYSYVTPIWPEANLGPLASPHGSETTGKEQWGLGPTGGDHRSTTLGGHIVDSYNLSALDDLAVQLNDTGYGPYNTDYVTGSDNGSVGDQSESEGDGPVCPQGRDADIGPYRTESQAMPIPSPGMITTPSIKHVCSEVNQSGTKERPCGESFETPYHLNQHIADVHGGYLPHVCKVLQCGRAFPLLHGLKRHHWTHVKRPGGLDRGNIKMDWAELKVILGNDDMSKKPHSRGSNTRPTHIPEMSPRRVNPPEDLDIDSCLEDFQTEPISTPGMINISRVEYVSPELDQSGSNNHPCGESSQSPHDLKHHIKAVHDEYRSYGCLVPDCGKRFTVECYLKRRYQSGCKKIEIADLKKTLAEEYEELARQLVEDLKKIPNKSQARDSNTRPNTGGDIESFSYSRHEIHNTARPYDCKVPVCGYTGKTYKALKSHYVSHFPLPATKKLKKKRRIATVTEEELEGYLKDDVSLFEVIKRRHTAQCESKP